jgi:hypothetical protein
VDIYREVKATSITPFPKDLCATGALRPVARKDAAPFFKTDKEYILSPDVAELARSMLKGVTQEFFINSE